jgi:hypothetical protein
LPRSRLPELCGGQVARNDKTTAGQHDKWMLLNNLQLKEMVSYDVL